MSDWLVGLDDDLTGRLRRCTLCGKAPVAFWGIAAARDSTLSIGYALCQSCRSKDKDLQQIEKFLEARYGKADQVVMDDSERK